MKNTINITRSIIFLIITACFKTYLSFFLCNVNLHPNPYVAFRSCSAKPKPSFKKIKNSFCVKYICIILSLANHLEHEAISPHACEY